MICVSSQPSGNKGLSCPELLLWFLSVWAKRRLEGSHRYSKADVEDFLRPNNRFKTIYVLKQRQATGPVGPVVFARQKNVFIALENNLAN